jgi:hypothetical protein
MATDKDRYLNGAYTSRRDVRREEWLDQDQALFVPTQEDIDQANDGSDW